MRDEPQSTAGPLAGVRVLAVENFMAGPFGSMMLADAGAEVMKIESPEGGDGSRQVARILKDEQGQPIGAPFVRFNRNKKSLTLNLRAEPGKEIFRRLVKLADVVWENFRPGVMDRLGLGYGALREINPRLIYTSVSGFGHLDIYPGPYWERPAFDMVVQAMAGLMMLPGKDGDPPLWLGFPLSDLYPSMLAAYGTLLALMARERTGRGQHVDIAMYDASVSLNERAVSLAYITGEAPQRGADPYFAPYGPFQAQDGFVVIGLISEPMWPRFCQALKRPDLEADPRLRNGMDRFRHMESVLKPIIDQWLADKTAEEAAQILLESGVPAAPVQTAKDLLRCPQVHARRMLLEFDYYGNRVAAAGNPVKLSASPEGPPSSPPRLGQHTEEILRTLLGIGPEEIVRLRAEGII